MRSVQIKVDIPFNFSLNWNPEYSLCKLPESYAGKIPEHWKSLLNRVPHDIGNTMVTDIIIKYINSYNTEDYVGESRAFQIEGFKDQAISNILFDNVNIEAKEFGSISYVKDIKMLNTKITIQGENNPVNDVFDHR